MTVPNHAEERSLLCCQTRGVFLAMCTAPAFLPSFSVAADGQFRPELRSPPWSETLSRQIFLNASPVEMLLGQKIISPTICGPHFVLLQYFISMPRCTTFVISYWFWHLSLAAFDWLHCVKCLVNQEFTLYFTSKDFTRLHHSIDLKQRLGGGVLCSSDAHFLSPSWSILPVQAPRVLLEQTQQPAHRCPTSQSFSPPFLSLSLPLPSRAADCCPVL